MTEPVAIVGWGGAFPGGATADALWTTLREGVDATSDPPAGRFIVDPEAVRARNPADQTPAADRIDSSRAGFLAPVPIDWTAVGCEPFETGDPLVGLVLTVGAAAWRSAVTEPVDPRRVGVALGNIALPTEGASALADATLGRAFARMAERTWGVELPEDPPFFARHCDRRVAGRPAGVLARALGLGGPQWSLDAACASSWFALELAVRALQRGRIDAALAGGASRPDPLYTQMGFSQLRALSRRGRCRPFDARADGLVVGEGAGLFVLKRLRDAVAHGDRIHAVVTGIGVSNDVDGRLLAPSVEGQLRAMRAAYREAGWRPWDVDLVECHATGTPTGDAIEFESLRTLWDDAERPHRPPCVLGAVKANVGHLLTGAGAAALAKVLLCFEHQSFVPVANFETPAEHVPLVGSPFEIPTVARPWTRRDAAPRRAALSGFGFGGTNAHVLIQDRPDADRRTQVAVPVPPRPAGAAVIGLGGRIGAWADRAELFARLLGTGPQRDPIPSPGFGGLPDPPRGHFIEAIEVQTGAFGIPPRELESCLPQQVLMLDVAEQAWVDAGRPDLAGARTGIWIGLTLDLRTTDHHLRWAMRRRGPAWARALGLADHGPAFEAWLATLLDALGPPLDANRTMGGLASITASRIARRFGVGGPSFVLSTEEGSGLAAVDAALEALRRGVVDRAIVGAVDVTADVRALLVDLDATPGSTPADGAVALVLEREDLADPDRVYAIVEGIGGSTGGAPTQPGPDASAYAESVERALEDAAVAGAEIGWVAAARGDAHERHGLHEIFAELPPFSSATEAVGHCGAASGLVSLAQACLSLARRTLPAHHDARGPRTARPWVIDRDRQSRRAIVASHGVGGACHHVVVRAAEGRRSVEIEAVPWAAPDADQLFAVEGDDAAALDRALERLVAIGEDTGGQPAARLAAGWAREHRRDPSARLGLCILARHGRQLAELAELARRHLDDPETLRRQSTGRVLHAPQPWGPRGEVALVYPGSGSHFPGMGRSLGLHFPSVLRELDRDHRRVRSQLCPPLLWDATKAAMDADPRGLILGQVAVGTLATAVLRRFGVQPRAAIGYSLGETAALFGLGAWRDRDEMLRRAETSSLFSEHLAGPCRAARSAWGLADDDPFEWTVGVVTAPADRVRQATDGLPQARLLIVNTPHECVIGGHRPAVEELARRLGKPLHRLEGITTVHCDVLAPVAEQYRAFHRLPTRAPAGVRFYSGAWGRAFAVDEDSAADSITANALHGIDFPKTIRAAYEDGVRVFVEVGPGSSCTRMIDAILGSGDARPYAAVSMSFAGADERDGLLRVLGTLLVHRVSVDLSPLQPEVDLDLGLAPRVPHRIEIGRRPLGPVPPRPALAARPPASSTPALAASVAGESAVRVDAGRPFVGPAAATAQAHATFLRLSAHRQRIGAALARARASSPVGSVPLPRTDPRPFGAVPPGSVPVAAVPAADDRVALVLDREQCLEFAVGTIGRVFGETFAEIDRHPTRVRLPDEPLMLVDRVVCLEGAPHSMGSGRIVTEHDVRAGSWYLDAGRIPTAVLIESGQADLMLSAWLGIDRQTRGLAVYRLLDATVTFSGPLPRIGQTVRHDIVIERFFEQAGVWLFRFHFESTVDGRPLVSMRDGCAGFFTPEHLAAGQGIVEGALRLAVADDASWTPPELVPLEPMTMDTAQLDALRAGDLPGAFGPAFAGLDVEDPLTIPDGRLRLLHRVIALEPTGGSGLGRIYGEYDVSPDDWFLTCHFVDDHVMPGTLMYECCLHTLRVLLLRRGWVAPRDAAAFEPIVGVKSRLRCRGQVLPQTRVVGYEIIVRRFVEGPEPAVVCDARMYADGKWIVDISDMTARLSGTTWSELRRRWSRRPVGPGPRTPVYDSDRILAFAEGKPSEAFGAPYRPFDAQRKIARLPRPPFSFMDRVTAVEGDPFVMKAGAFVEAQVAVPADAWYFEANRQPDIPLCVLLEMALQPCGWLAAYVGSALTTPERLRFRNLGGEATLHDVVRGADLLTMRARLTAVSHAASMLIQHFDFDVLAQGRASVYSGKTYFGFFTDDALADQVGIREAKLEPLPGHGSLPGHVVPGSPMPGPMLRMVERIDALHLDGGRHGLGLVQGHVEVDPSAWFFTAHFFEDPVWPGSLGLESFLQLLKVWAIHRFDLPSHARFGTAIVGAPQQWTYRGQVTPDRRRVTVQASIRSVEGDPALPSGARVDAEGFLCVDGRAIYRIDRLGLSVHVPSRPPEEP